MKLVLAPVAWLMGVPWADCGEVAVLLGKKTVLNEFIAYLDLKGLIEKKEISERAAVISTYASVALRILARLAFKLVALVELHPNVRKIWHN